jgi:alkylation response protein AidB-like acyl-CoA dehydrogenase
MSGAAGHDLLAESEDQAALRQLARDVASREVAPRAHQGDEEGEVAPEVRKALAEADLLRVTIGEKWGGLGLGDVEAAIVLEEIARADVSSAICCQLTFNGPPRGIEHLGPDAMKERWLPDVANGDALISIGITEPDAGPAAGASTPTRTTRRSVTWPRGFSSGAAGPEARAPRASGR